MNRYETVFIMTPVLSAEQVAETVSKFRAFVTDKGGKILHEDAWGLRKLAYPIQKKSTGFYHLMEFEAASSSKTLNDIASSWPSNPLMVLAKIRAEVVFPTPRGPQKR